MSKATAMRASGMLFWIAFGAILGQYSAHAGERLDRLGRLWGYGWSDGYHACAADDYCFGENLPPHSYASQGPCQGSCQRPPSRCLLAPQGSASRPSGCDWDTAVDKIDQLPGVWENLDEGSSLQPLPTPPPEPVSPLEAGQVTFKFPRKLSLPSPDSGTPAGSPVVERPPSRLGSHAPERLPSTAR